MTLRSPADTRQLWKLMCEDMQVRLSEAVFNTWVLSNPMASFEDLDEEKAKAVFTSPSAFHATNIKRNLAEQMAKSLFKLTGKVVELSFEVGAPKVPASSTTSTQAPVKPVPTSPDQTVPSTNPGPSKPSFSAQTLQSVPQSTPPPTPTQTTSPRVEDLFSPQTMESNAINRAEHMAKKAGLRPDYTFTTFAVSTTNEMAHAAATAVSKNPGLAYNPLFLYGGVGVGKTHLMQAIGNNILHQNDQLSILYCTGEEFTNEIVSAIQTKKALHFKAKYRAADVLLIDDVQFIAGKNAVQEEFFHTFNAVIKRHGQIVLTSDRPPHEIHLLEDRLRSRFEAGLMIDIQEPSFELRTAILLIKSQAHNLVLPMSLAQQIATHVSSARKIEGIVKSLRSEVELKGRELNQELIDDILKQDKAQTKSSKLRVKPDQVIKTVANHYHIKQIVLKGRKRQKNIVKARHVAMFILKTDLDLPYVEIGRWFSNRDHTSVMHAVSKITDQLPADQPLEQEVSAIRTSLTAIAK